ncbi:glucosyltransferase domain-containing protein [Enterococcus faecalis]
MIQKKKAAFYAWLNDNKVVLLTVFGIYQIVILAIGIVNYPYIDDIYRQLKGSTNFALHYSRWGSEIASWIVQGSRHLTDMGLTTHILTAAILAVASIIALHCLTEKITILLAIASTIIGLNPWFLQCISFRFDSPYMALSILFSFLPFLWWKKDKYIFFGMSFISLLLMYNTYQSSSGIYIIMVLALSLKDLLSGKLVQNVSIQIVLSALGYVLSTLAYVLETTFNAHLVDRGDVVKTASLKDLPETVNSNIKMYLTSIYDQSSKVWILLFSLIVCLFILSVLLTSHKSPIKATIYSLVYLVLAAIFSYGVYLIFIENLAELQPRYAYGFSIFVAITIILLLDNVSYLRIKVPVQIVTCLFCYYVLTFPLVYASTLHYQFNAFETQSVMLATDLKELVNSSTPTVYANRLFKNSPIFDNTSRNYKLLQKLVPDNASLYWPNQQLFTTITGMKRKIMPFNPAVMFLDEQNLKVNNYYYKIYKQNNFIYIIYK